MSSGTYPHLIFQGFKYFLRSYKLILLFFLHIHFSKFQIVIIAIHLTTLFLIRRYPVFLTNNASTLMIIEELSIFAYYLVLCWQSLKYSQAIHLAVSDTNLNLRRAFQLSEILMKKNKLLYFLFMLQWILISVAIIFVVYFITRQYIMSEWALQLFISASALIAVLSIFTAATVFFLNVISYNKDAV
jgi:hypothetical protein